FGLYGYVNNRVLDSFPTRRSSDLTFISLALNNADAALPTPQVQVQSGTLRLQGGGTSSGNFSIDAGTALEFFGGTHNLNAGASRSDEHTSELHSRAHIVNAHPLDN